MANVIPTVSTPRSHNFFNQGLKDYNPVLFSKKLLHKIYNRSLITATTNTDHEGEIKKYGDTIFFRETPDITIQDDDGGQISGHISEGFDIDADIDWGKLSSDSKSMVINRAIKWAFKYDEITGDFTDMKNYVAAVINVASRRVAERQSVLFLEQMFSNTDVFNPENCNAGANAGFKSNAFNLGTAINPITITKENATDFLVNISSVLDEQGVLDDENNIGNEKPFVVAPNIFGNVLAKSDLKAAHITGDSVGIIRRGQRALGSLCGFDIWKTNQISQKIITTGSGNSEVTTKAFPILFGLQQATTFATKVERLKHVDFQNNFYKGMAGLQIYGHKVLYAERLGLAWVRFAI